MQKVAIVTDGVSDLTQKQVDDYNITTVPFRIFFGDEIYRVYHNEKGSIDLPTFLTKLETINKETHPKTSIPSPGEIAVGFEEALKKADSVIGIFLSGSMSGIVQAAQTVAREKFSDKDISIFDSKHTMSGVGIQALEAAKMAKDGKTKEEILKRLESLNPRVRTIFVMFDLNYLYKGGRIGRAKKLLGSAFNVIPAVHLKDGIMNSLTSFKGEKKLKAGMKNFAQKIIEQNETGEIFITHINQSETTKEMIEVMKEANGNETQIHHMNAGPILGVYSGPKTICVSYIGNFDPDWLS